MAVDAEKVLQELKRRFSEPLPEFYRRHIIFWHDEEREFADRIGEIEIDGVKVVTLTENNAFTLKKLLAKDDVDSHYLVYCPVTFESDEANWLLNIELYSGEPFRADIHTIWLEEMGLGVQENLRILLKQYHKFFNAKERRVRFARFSKQINQSKDVCLGMMASICGCKELEPTSIIRAVLMGGLRIEDNEIYQRLVTYDVHELFWKMVKQGTGYDAPEPSLSEFVIHLFLTAASRTLEEVYFGGLEDYISSTKAAFCYDFVSEWLMSQDHDALLQISEFVEAEKNIYQRLINYQCKDLNEERIVIEQLIETECFPCIHEVLLVKLMTDISNHQIQVEKIKNVVEARRTCAWYESYSCYYEALYQIALMQKFYLEHTPGFNEAVPSRLWDNYTKDYYRMDMAYRKFHKAFIKSLKTTHAHFDDLMKQVAERAEGLYSTWFLENLSECWHKASAGDFEKNGRIKDVQYQTNFYGNRVSKADSRVFVVISDALRFEVAVTLAEQLRQETQSEVQLTSMQGIFPTVTSFGMAALLPHRRLSVAEGNQRLTVLADDMPTDASHRDQILKAANPQSVALQYRDIIGLKRAERSALVKGMEVVYIYHDKIDEASHTSDDMVFSACDDAIDEIKNILKIIYNEFNGTRIFITADHGFLYTYQPLAEDSKVGKESWGGKAVEYSRRYAIMKNDASPEHLAPICFLDGKSPYKAFAPFGNVRIKMSGGGLNYVHGGASLQEMVVPLIDFHYIRAGSKMYQKNREKYDTLPVTIELLSTSRKISNMIFSLDFYQKEKVGSNRTAATYSIYFIDSRGKVVSDMGRIIADRSEAENQKRVYRVGFNLKSMQFDNKATYYLMIVDESGIQQPVRIEFQIDIAFAVDEFNFFA